jgi:hypothetical protein
VIVPAGALPAISILMSREVAPQLVMRSRTVAMPPGHTWHVTSPIDCGIQHGGGIWQQLVVKGAVRVFILGSSPLIVAGDIISLIIDIELVRSDSSMSRLSRVPCSMRSLNVTVISANDRAEVVVVFMKTPCGFPIS